jgi:type I restriction enzyme, R subunit
LETIVELTKKISNPEAGASYPQSLDPPARRVLYDNLRQDEALALAVDCAVRESRQDDWRSNPFKVRMVRNSIKQALQNSNGGMIKELPASYVTGAVDPADAFIEKILELVKNQRDY